MFNVGEKIVYPMHGAGVIEAIESRENAGVSTEYYKVRIFNGNIMLMIPVENRSEVRLRHIIDSEKAEKLLTDFKSYISDDVPWNKRYKFNVERLKTGSIEDTAAVLGELILREKTHGLSTSDRKMFVLAKNILCSELSIALDSDGAEIFERILSDF